MAAAKATAAVSGMEDYEFVVIPYPLPPPGEWSDDEIDLMAKRVAPAVARRLSQGR